VEPVKLKLTLTDGQVVARNKPYLQRYRCKACGKQFSDLTGTPFAWTRAAAERYTDNSVPVLQAWDEPAGYSQGDR